MLTERRKPFERLPVYLGYRDRQAFTTVYRFLSMRVYSKTVNWLESETRQTLAGYLSVHIAKLVNKRYSIRWLSFRLHEFSVMSFRQRSDYS